MIQSYIREVLISEQLPDVVMIVQHNYILPGILKLNMHVISKYITEFLILTTLQFLDITKTELL